MSSLSYNPILNTDSYKHSHFRMSPPKTKYVNSYIEPRGGRYNRALFFGLQMYLKEYLSQPITKENIEEAEEFLPAHGEPFCKANWEYILDKHGGYFPLSIQAIEEGRVIDISNALVQIINTDPNCWYLPQFVESPLLRSVWYPVTVATMSYMIKQIYKTYLEKTCDDPENNILFALNDFGARGSSCYESSGIAGAAHLVNFLGTDTIQGIRTAQHYYNTKEMLGYSVPASEHSVTCQWGKENELKFFKYLLENFGTGIVSAVSDTYNYYNAIENLWPQLKNQIQELSGRLVVRPDSGNPVVIVSNTINILMSNFGFTVNSKGYKVLPPYLRVIQGDGINDLSIRDILNELVMQKISVENVIFGCGGALHQPTRDMMMFAQKASACCIDGVWKDINKDPITDSSKKSKRGVLSVVYNKSLNKYETILRKNLAGKHDFLQEVWRDGHLLKDYTFNEIRERSNEGM